MNFTEFYLTERKDVQYSSQIDKISEMIISFLKRNKNRLFSVAYYTNKGYYIPFQNIDIKSKFNFNDLFFAILPKDSASIKSKEGMINNAALEKIKDDNNFYYIIKLYILDDNETLNNAINKLINSQQWRISLNHELTHYLDNKKFNTDSDDSERKKLNLNDEDINIVLDSLKKYHNLSDEINAHFMQTSTAFLNSTKKRKSNIDYITIPFESFKEAFIYFYGKQAFKNLSEDNRKRVLKRIYLFYKDIQEYVKKKQRMKK